MKHLLLLLLLVISIQPFAQNLTSYYDVAKSSYGYKDSMGKIVIQPSYLFAMNFSEGLSMVQTPKSSGSKYGFINTTNNMVIPAIYKSAESFAGGLSVVSDSLSYFFIDKTGKRNFPQTFFHARSFSNGLAAVMNKDSLWGYCGPTGNLVIPYQYKTPGHFSEGLAFVQKDKNWLAINQKNEVKFEKDAIRIWSYKNGFAAIQLKEKGRYNYGDEWNFIDKKGKLLSNDRFEFFENFDGNTAIVHVYDNSTKSLKYGAIDTTGKVVIPLVYATLKKYGKGFIYNQSSSLGAQWFGLIDGRYKVVTKEDYKFLKNFGDSLFVVQIRDKYLSKANLINLDGKELIPLSYQSFEMHGTSANPILLFYTDYGRSMPGRTYSVKHGLIGKYLCIPNNKYNVFIDTEGLENFSIMDLDGKPLIDKSFKVKYHFSYRNIGADADQYEKVQRRYPVAGAVDSTWFFDKKTKKLLAMKYYVLEEDDFSNGMLKVTNNFKFSKYSSDDKTKFGFLDSSFKLAIPIIYTQVYNFREGRARFAKTASDGFSKKVGFIDKSGKEVIKAQYDDATDYKNGYCIAEGGGKTSNSISVLDKAGKQKVIIENVKYSAYADVTEDGLLFIENEQGKWGLWNLEGKNLVPAEYSIDKDKYYPRFGNTNYVPLMKDGKTYYYDKKGKLKV